MPQTVRALNKLTLNQYLQSNECTIKLQIVKLVALSVLLFQPSRTEWLSHRQLDATTANTLVPPWHLASSQRPGARIESRT